MLRPSRQRQGAGPPPTESGLTTSTGDITSGNLLDAVQFRQYYRMDFQTPPSGSGTYSTDGETPVAFDSAASAAAAASSVTPLASRAGFSGRVCSLPSAAVRVRPWP